MTMKVERVLLPGGQSKDKARCASAPLSVCPLQERSCSPFITQVGSGVAHL